MRQMGEEMECQCRGRSSSRYMKALMPALALLAILAATSPASAALPAEVAATEDAFGLSTATAERNLRVQHRAGDIVKRLESNLGSRYAGVWFDPQAGEFVVPTTTSAGRTSALNLFAESGMAGDQRAPLVPYSWDELLEAQRQLSADIGAAGFNPGTLQTWIDSRANSVALELASSMTSVQAEMVHRIASQFGPKVEIRASTEPLFQAQTLSCKPYYFEKYCSAPLRGGVGINPHGDTEYICTAGFRARGDNGRRYLITAGHCAARNGQPLTYWDSMDEQLNILGQSREELEQHLHYVGALESYSFPTHDWAKIDATSQAYDSPNWPARTVYWGENTGLVIDESYAITSEADAYENQIVCHSGATTGTSCAPVDRVDLEPLYVGGDGPSGLVYHENRAHGGCAYGGDSGGPVFADHQALGIISAGDNLDA